MTLLALQGALAAQLLGHVSRNSHQLLTLSRQRVEHRDVYVQPQADQLHSAAADVVCAGTSLLAAKASLGNCLSALAS